MLYSVEIVREVARFLQGQGRIPLVVDPVMVSTSGARLMKAEAVRALCKELLPMAALVTPNLHEAALLLVGKKIGSVEEMRRAAKELRRKYGCAALVKGGHLGGVREAVDVFYDGENELLLSAPFIRGVRTHGTGCTYSAAITAHLARGVPMTRAVRLAKDFITRAIDRSRTVGKHTVLGS
jgi:hydroxymethylpyrimidine/phosphomethylpyrimidine kinase